MTAIEDRVSLSIAARQIGSDVRPLDPRTLREAARRLGILRQDEDGNCSIPSAYIGVLRSNYRSFGYLAPRGCRHLSAEGT
jgi:hypothetical protein